MHRDVKEKEQRNFLRGKDTAMCSHNSQYILF